MGKQYIIGRMKVYNKKVDIIMDKGLQISADITPTDQKSGNSKTNMVALEKYNYTARAAFSL